jgi:hypothetical protein
MTLNDERGSSTCPRDEERYEIFRATCLGKDLVHYDYRAPDGMLFSCIAPNLERARKARDAWLASNPRFGCLPMTPTYAFRKPEKFEEPE